MHEAWCFCYAVVQSVRKGQTSKMQKNSGANTTKVRDRKKNVLSNTVPFDEILRSELQDREIAVGYVNALLSEEDEQGVLLALRDIADAMTMSEVAKTAGVNRESLYKMLSGWRDPRFGTVLRVLKALGITLRAVDTRFEIEHSLETAEEPKTCEASPKTPLFIGKASRTSDNIREA